MPPSAMTGTPVPRSSLATDWTAVNCGTPMPATTRVVQIEPGPMPTLTPSAPASTRARPAAAVATLPATTSTAKRLLSSFTVFMTLVVWPWAVSTTSTSTSTPTRASALS